MTVHYEREEVEQLLEQLFKDTATMNALNTFARMQAPKTAYGYHAYRDLIAETVSRALALKRRWRREDSTLDFFRGAIRSVAWEWKEPWDKSAHPDYEKGPVIPVATNSEHELETKQLAEQLLVLFDDDPIAQRIFIGMVEGLMGEELKEKGGHITQTEYESKRTLIRRRIQRFMISEEAND